MGSDCAKGEGGVAVPGELRALLVGLSISSDADGAVERDIEYWMRRFDRDRSGAINYQEFSHELSE